jgi:Signal peptide binding domain
MYEQFQNIMKLGPISQVMGMIPGLSSIFGQVSLLVYNSTGSNPNPKQSRSFWWIQIGKNTDSDPIRVKKKFILQYRYTGLTHE